MKLSFIAPFAAFILAIAPAHAGLFSIGLVGAASASDAAGMSISKVADVMRENGFAVELGADGAGDPVIYSETAGLNFALFGFNCAGADALCNEFLFSTYFDLDAAPSLKAINSFNEKALAGRAFIDDDGDANLEHLFSITCSEDTEQIERNLAIWESVIIDFSDHLDEAGSSSS